MWAIMAERRKHIMFREVWVSCFICVLYLLVTLFQDLQDIDLIQRSPANKTGTAYNRIYILTAQL